MAEPALKLQPDEKKNSWGDDLHDDFLPPTHHEVEEGEGNWLVSYADMMTLLVGFFVVLQSFSKIDAGSFEKIKKETTKLFGGQYSIPYEKLQESLKKVIEEKKLTDQVMFETTDEGIEITFKGALFFELGSSELRPEAIGLLDQLIPVIAEQAKDYGIVVEGHTDTNRVVATNTPISSNWELSSVRACKVLRLFEERGFSPLRMKALGWGETRPIVPNTDAAGKPIPANQAQNRRVVIKILKNFEG